MTEIEFRHDHVTLLGSLWALFVLWFPCSQLIQRSLYLLYRDNLNAQACNKKNVIRTKLHSSQLYTHSRPLAKKKGRCSRQRDKSLCLNKSSATINQYISTPVVHPLIVMATKHILMSYCTHCSIVDVQPSVPTTALSVRVEHVDSIVPTATGGLAAVVEHPIELVTWGLHRNRFSGHRCHGFWNDRAMGHC